MFVKDYQTALTNNMFSSSVKANPGQLQSCVTLEYSHAMGCRHCHFCQAKPFCQDERLLYPACNITMPYETRGAFLDVLMVRKGMLVSLFDFTPREQITVQSYTEESPVNFGAILSGTAEFHYKAAGINRIHTTEPQEVIKRTGEIAGQFVFPKKKRIQMVSVSLSDEALSELLTEHGEYNALTDMLCARQNTITSLAHWAITPAMNLIAGQMFQCPLQGTTRRMYMESKALEILSLQLDRLVNNKRRIPLGKDDIERLHEARKILFKSIKTPPSIQQLAAAVGINDFKLKQGFRKLFGNTVYGILREHRMETAQAMLLDSDMTVAAVAEALGYTNSRHFIRAFKNHYNITPGKFSYQARRSYNTA